MTASQSDPAAVLALRTHTRARNAFRISMVALVVCAIYAGYLFVLAFQVGTVERYRAAFMIGGLALIAALSAWLSRREHSTLGIILLLSWLYAAVLESPTRQAGQGLLLGSIAITMTIVVAALTLNRRWSLRMIIASIVVCMAAVLLDIYGSSARPSYGLGAPLVMAVISLVAFLIIVARQFPTYSLRTKLIIAFLTVSLISIGVIALYANLTIQRALQDQASAELVNVAQLQSTTIGDLLVKEAELLRTLGLDDTIREAAAASNTSYPPSQAEAQQAILALDQEWISAANANDDTNPLIRSKLDNPIAQYLREFRTTYPENVEVFVTDRNGALLGATNRTSDYYQADESWWQSAYNNGQGALYYTQPEYDASSGKFSIDIATPIYEDGGKNISGIMRTTVDLSSLVSLLAQVQENQRGRVDLLLPDNTFMQAQGAVKAPGNILAELPVESATTSEIDWEGVPSFAAVALLHATDPELTTTIDQLNWRVIAHQSSAEVLAPVEAQARTVLIVMALIAALVTATSIGMSQVLVRPITRLTVVATKVAEGDLTAQAVVETPDEIGTLASTFNSMTAQLRSVVTSLEERVEARTAQLRASSEVSRAAASILSPEQLMSEVVNLITERFGFYYAAVFLADENNEWAVLQAATGEAGKILKERDHRLLINGQSMVGTSMRARRPRVALEVGDEAVRFANPLLPDTRSEVALPLIVGRQVLGALDVQSTQVAAFDDASTAVLQAMADQIAIALSNTFQFQQTETALQNARRQNDVSLALSQAEDATSMLYALVAYGTEDADRAAILLYGPQDTFGRFIYVEVDAGWTRFASEQPLLAGTRFTADQLPFLMALEPSEPFVINDVADSDVKPENRQALSAWNARAMVALALTMGDKNLGALIFTFSQPRHFTKVDVDSFQTYARQTAIVLRNRQLVNESQTALHQIDEINRRLTGQAWEEYRTAAGQPLRKVNWQQGLPEDVDNGQKSTAAAPVVVNGVEIGVLRLEDPVPDREWPSEDLSLLAAVASEVSIAVEKARLIEETERRAQREQTINRIAGRVRNAASVDQMLAIAAQELRLEMQATRTVAEIEPENQLRPDQRHTAQS